MNGETERLNRHQKPENSYPYFEIKRKNETLNQRSVNDGVSLKTELNSFHDF